MEGEGETCHDFDEFCSNWSPGDVKARIHLYREHTGRLDKLQKKNVWEEVAAEMRKIRQKAFTGEQCNGKWKGLKSMYKKVKDHNNTSGNNKKSWEYFDDMDEILNRRPEITPRATCSSDESFVRIPSTSERPDYNFEDMFEDTSASSSYRKALVPSTSRRMRREEAQAAAAAKYREEKLAQTNRFLDLFEKLVERLNKLLTLTKKQDFFKVHSLFFKEPRRLLFLIYEKYTFIYIKS